MKLRTSPMQAAVRLLMEEDLNPEALFIGEPGETRFDAAIIGIGERCGQPALVVYDYEKIIQVLVADGMSEEEAAEYVDFNIAGAWLGEHTPMIVYSYAG